MTFLAIFLSLLLFTYHSYSASTETFLAPEYPDSVEEDVTSDPRGSKRYSVEELKCRGLEFNPYVKSDYLEFLKSRAECERHEFLKKKRAQKKVSIYDFVPVDSIRAYRQELKRNDELLKKDEPLDICTEDPCALVFFITQHKNNK